MKLRPELLLHLNIPKPLHGLNPRTILGQEWWDRTRQESYKRTNYHCSACGIHKSKAKYHQWLEAHENCKIDYEKGRVEVIEINALCHSCHSFIHDGLLRIKYEKGEIPYEKYEDVLNHGESVLRNAGLVKPNYPTYEDFPPVKWQDWRLILDGKEYPPLWEDYLHWSIHYDN